MERHPDLTRARAQHHIAGLLANSAHARAIRRADALQATTWRRSAGAALVRLGEAILGDTRPTALRPAVSTR